MKEGILNAIAVGARAIEWEWRNPREPQGGRRYTKSELLELSVVLVGANPEARIVSRDFTDRDLERAIQKRFGCSRRRAAGAIAYARSGEGELEDPDQVELLDVFRSYREKCRLPRK